MVNILGLSKKDYKCKTVKAYLHGAEDIHDMKRYLLDNVPAIMKIFQLPVDIADHLVRTYGRAHVEIIHLIKSDDSLKERLGEGRPHIAAEIADVAGVYFHLWGRKDLALDQGV